MGLKRIVYGNIYYAVYKDFNTGRGIVSVQSLPQLPQWIKPLECEIVEHTLRKIRMIVYVNEVNEEDLRIIARGNTLIVYGRSSDKTYFCRLNLRFKPKRINYKYRNGVLTVDAYASFWSFLRRLFGL